MCMLFSCARIEKKLKSAFSLLKLVSNLPMWSKVISICILLLYLIVLVIYHQLCDFLSCVYNLYVHIRCMRRCVCTYADVLRSLRTVTMYYVQIDKKGSSRSRDNLVPLTDVLASLKPSEFTDFQLARYKVLPYHAIDLNVLPTNIVKPKIIMHRPP